MRPSLPLVPTRHPHPVDCETTWPTGPASADEPASGLPGIPLSTPTVMQVPAVPFVELQVCVAGQLLPPVPRQPATHTFVVLLQTRPDVAPPQLVSVEQPHVSEARQAEPVPVARQFCVSVEVQATQ